MLVRPYFLTLLLSGDGEPVPTVSPDPGLEKEWIKGTDYYKVLAWERPFPLWLAEAICQELAALPAAAGCGRPFSPAKIERMICRRARKRGWPATGRWFEPPERPVFPGLFEKRERFTSLLPQVLAGRMFSLREIAGSLSRMGLTVMEGALEFLVHLEVLDGRVERLAGIGLTADGRFHCRRCGEEDRILEDFYPESPLPCRVCGSCLALGPVTSLQPLYCRRGALLKGTSPVFLKGPTRRSPQESPGEGPQKSPRESPRESPGERDRRVCAANKSPPVKATDTWPLLLPGENRYGKERTGKNPAEKGRERLQPLVLPELTPWQKATAREVLAFWERKEQRSFLIWAVCGAGKTEVVFLTIHRALSEGKRVLLTVPRREIVKDLGKRVEDCFPGLEFTLLYGGKKQERPGGGLVVATTHQLLRFTPFFDLAILDEADAYPYRENRMLAGALANALLPGGKLIYMTATPDEEWRKKAARGEIGLSRLVLRHHGHPLPVPVLYKQPLPPVEAEDWPPPPEVLSFLRRAGEKNRQVLLFLPTVRLAEKAGRALKNAGLLQTVDYIHSRDGHKDRKLQAFDCGRLQVLATTTLLERGLTFPRLDVLVLYADREEIFTTETLVQIAGRVGRSGAAPFGEVIFIGERISRAMEEARLWIAGMNKEAEESGFLKQGTSHGD
ncbi:MAG: DEAD/DEAH box helicase family protein [Firmicutes bacterium]|nr:DEAD/DEAH box helicase family protein [Bacillota bacterium]